ncbi:protein Turandot X [Drosophila subpulchrella]|uniref:protein Turandot X n=1 Tax=Drosophila subpulchrella TaxID=1486046 RepID=UPI0018A13391|nr:protein Turandot X [Drosophila subpulchrella]
MGFYFSILLVVMLSIVCSVSADIDCPNYDAQRNRILDIYHNPIVNDLTKERNIPDLISFYRRYPNAVSLSDSDKQQFDRFIHNYQEFRTVLIDGVPPQGGTIGSIFGNFLGRVGSRYVLSLFNQKQEGQANRGTNSTVLP